MLQVPRILFIFGEPRGRIGGENGQVLGQVPRRTVVHRQNLREWQGVRELILANIEGIEDGGEVNISFHALHLGRFTIYAVKPRGCHLQRTIFLRTHPHHRLNRALAVGTHIPEHNGAPRIPQMCRDNFARRGTGAVNEHHHRSIKRDGATWRNRQGLHEAIIANKHDGTRGDKKRRKEHRLLETAAAIAAQIEDESLNPRGIELAQIRGTFRHPPHSYGTLCRLDSYPSCHKSPANKHSQPYS